VGALVGALVGATDGGRLDMNVMIWSAALKPEWKALYTHANILYFYLNDHDKNK